MAKYTNTAGFKAISNENTEEPSEKLPRPLLFLIVGGIIVIGFIGKLFNISKDFPSNEIIELEIDDNNEAKHINPNNN